jgi:hypothetical protein
MDRRKTAVPRRNKKSDNLSLKLSLEAAFLEPEIRAFQQGGGG